VDEAVGSSPGKIRAVLRLIEDHPVEAAYDWRTRFGLPVAAVFDGRMSWDEAYDLARGLLADPTSRLAAARAGWDHPLSREAMIFADLYDLTVAANTDRRKGKPKPYPRPFKPKGKGARHATAAPTVTQAQIDAALRARGHHIGKERRDQGRNR
jgi:hypothetical protein